MRSHAKAWTAGSTSGRGGRQRAGHTTLLAFVTCAVALLVIAPGAQASKSVFSFFGNASGSASLGGQLNGPHGVAVNNTSGDIYVVEQNNNRVSRFDSSHSFIGAWGFDVIQAGKPGDLGTGVFEVCTIAADCKAGIDSVSPAPGGELSFPQGIAIDQATGNVYVTNREFLRVDVFSASGSFIRAFGKDVDNVAPGTGTEVCTVAANCKTGETGSLGGEFASTFSGHVAIAPAGAPNAGNAILADPGNSRVQEFTSAGAFVRTFGFDVAGAGAGAENTGTGFEVCTEAVAGAANCQTAAAAGSEVGQFGASQPIRVAADSTGAIYTVENTGADNRRVQKFVPQVGPPPLLPEVFAAGSLSGNSFDSGPTDVQIGASDKVFVVKAFPFGATPSCPFSGSPSFEERRVLELDAAGALQDTHMACSTINSVLGLGLNPTSGRLYLSSTTADNRVYVLDDVTAPAATIDPVTDFDPFGASFEGEVDPNATRTDYRFEYSADGGSTWTCLVKPDCSEPANLIDAGSGNSPVPVSGEATGLVPDTLYQVRLSAIKPFGAGTAIGGPVGFTTTAIPATTLTRYVAPRTDTTARLNGFVNPNNNETEVHFEYGTVGPCSANPCESTEPQDVDSAYLPETVPMIPVAAELEELEQGTTYYYSLVADNGVGAPARGAERTFTTRTAAEVNLPTRAYELVNNPDKGNQNVTEGPISADGEKALWRVTGGAPGGNSGSGSAFLAERDPQAGWQVAHDLIPPAAEQINADLGGYDFLGASPDLSHFFFRPGVSLTSPPSTTMLRLDDEQNQDVLKTYAKSVGKKFDLTTDGDHVLYVDPDTGVLEDIGTPGAPEVVGLMPDGSLPECGVDQEGQSFVGGGNNGAGKHWRKGYHLIDMDDASRVYFQVRPNGECNFTDNWHLLVRNREMEATIEISPPARGALIRATPDGRSAYFATSAALDPDDTNPNVDIYRWDEEAGASSCLTCVVANANVRLEGGFGGISTVMVSDDFSHIYFESDSVLAPGATAGKHNLYALSGGAFRFIATMNTEGSALGSDNAKLSADGNVLLFRTDPTGNLELTADQLAPSCQLPGGSEGSCTELFRYDDRDQSLECLSCTRDGVTTNALGTPSAATVPLFDISADGETAAFVTAEALTPLDVNDGVDLYEWRNGVRRLITDGVTSFPAGSGAVRPVGLSSDGRDIFFVAVAPGLTGFELDRLANLYDARIGGGFEPPPPDLRCHDEGCQGPLEAAPQVSQPASSSFSGHGNLAATPPRCNRAAVRRGNRCVRKRTLANRACRAKRGKARRRCVDNQTRRLNRIQRRQLRNARAQADMGRAK